MTESWVNLSCPTCGKAWTASPSALPGPDDDLVCADCDATATTVEFLRTARDLEIYRSLAD